MKIITRIIVAIFLLPILLIAHNFFAIKRVIQFIRYGGEIILYKKDEQLTIENIYQELKKK
jgi:hypothetical protein